MIWPFPLLRNYPTSESLSSIFLEVANSKLEVLDTIRGRTTIRCPLGKITFWSDNPYYAWASEGSIVYPSGKVVRWRNIMPSRWAVRQMVRAIDKARFKM